MNQPRVIVVGGGLAGMAAAIRVADLGASVRLFETAPRLGGATRSFVRDGLTYDNGQHVFMRCCSQYRLFLERIGSAGKVTIQPRLDVPVQRPGDNRSALRRAKLPAPVHLVPALARYRAISVVERLRAARTAIALSRLDPDDPTLDDQTFGQWLADHGATQKAVDALWGLVCRATVNLPADAASLMLAAKVFRVGLIDTVDGGDLGWSTVPLQELHGDAATVTLQNLGGEVHTGARVAAVRSEPGGGPVAVVDGEEFDADAIVVAVPHDAISQLLPLDSFHGQRDAAKLGHSPIVNVHLLYDRPVLDGPFLAALDSPVQFVFDRTVSSGAPAGHQMLAISLSAADDYIAWPRADLVAHFSSAIAALLPAARDAHVVASAVVRERGATFRGVPGTASLRPGASTDLSGVFLAGAWTDTGWPATMEGAVRSGMRAAEEVHRYLSRVEPLREPA